MLHWSGRHLWALHHSVLPWHLVLRGGEKTHRASPAQPTHLCLPCFHPCFHKPFFFLSGYQLAVEDARYHYYRDYMLRFNLDSILNDSSPMGMLVPGKGLIRYVLRGNAASPTMVYGPQPCTPDSNKGQSSSTTSPPHPGAHSSPRSPSRMKTKRYSTWIENNWERVLVIEEGPLEFLGVSVMTSIKEAVWKLPLDPELGSNSFPHVSVVSGELSFDNLPLRCLLISYFTLESNSSTYPLVKANKSRQIPLEHQKTHKPLTPCLCAHHHHQAGYTSVK